MLDHITEKHCDPEREKGFEAEHLSIWSAQKSADRQTNRPRDGKIRRDAAREQTDRMRESIEQVPVTSAPVGTTIRIPLHQPRTIDAYTMHRPQRHK